MKTFKDASGKEWIIDVNVETIEKVKDLQKVDLTQLFDDPNLMPVVIDNPIMLADILYTLCGMSGDKRALKLALKGDFLEQATNALLQDLIDFFPNAHRRRTLTAMVAKGWEVTEASLDKMDRELAELKPESLLSVTSSPGLPESNPAN